MGTRARRNRWRLRYEDRLFLVTLLSGFPAVVFTLVYVWSAGFSLKVPITVTLVVVLVWIVAALAVRERAMRPLQTVSNVIAALSEGDTSLRGRVRRRDDALGQAFLEANRLVDLVRAERLRVVEAHALLRRVLEAIDVAVFGFDESRRLKLHNATALELVGLAPEEALERTARDLGLEATLEGPSPRVVDLELAARAGRFEARRSVFRERGLPHQLVLLTDLSRTLHAEERHAWRDLLRVLSHEINNSLAPIQSVAETLLDALGERVGSEEAQEDAREGLRMISKRAASLHRFLRSYAQLARLPAPEEEDVDVTEWVCGVAALEKRLEVEVRAGPLTRVRADRGQLDQLLINLVSNGVEAAERGGGRVWVGWRRNGKDVVVTVEDNGVGLADTVNLFVPFYTTKTEGSGIGLALSRQIAESHGGTLELVNRADGPGAIARLRLPLGYQA